MLRGCHSGPGPVRSGGPVPVGLVPVGPVPVGPVPVGPVPVGPGSGRSDSIFFVFGFFSYIVGSFLLAAPLVQMYVRSLCIYWDCNSHNNNLTRVYYMIYMWLIGIAVQTHMQRVINTW